ncbi:MAG TPA: hypothetical protein VK549_14305 [Acidimicrobiia bacterium]|nr:hypothetical protein [Acidimicrobiia bacterium]
MKMRRSWVGLVVAAMAMISGQAATTAGASTSDRVPFNVKKAGFVRRCGTSCRHQA